jgi:hypothetical protein
MPLSSSKNFIKLRDLSVPLGFCIQLAPLLVVFSITPSAPDIHAVVPSIEKTEYRFVLTPQDCLNHCEKIIVGYKNRRSEKQKNIFFFVSPEYKIFFLD